MQVVVADTGPLQYLLLIGQIELLPTLFGSVFLPTEVHAELLHPTAPAPRAKLGRRAASVAYDLVSAGL